MNTQKKYFSLDHKIVFYIPSTKDKGTKISSNEFDTRTELIAGILSDTFGGATIAKTQGFYKTTEGTIIVEDVNQVISYTNGEDLRLHSQKIFNLALKMKQDWTQESIGLEIDRELFFIS